MAPPEALCSLFRSLSRPRRRLRCRRHPLPSSDPRQRPLGETGLTAVASGETPPTFGVCLDPTAAVLAGQTDGVVVVVRNEETGGLWTALDTERETIGGADYLCASGVEAPGAFSLGGSEGAFPVAGEHDGPADTRPEALAVRTFPNPASGAVTVEVAMPEASEVRVAVFDALGREVAVLHDGPLAAGIHPLVLDTRSLPAGVYVARVLAPEAAVSVRATVVR